MADKIKVLVADDSVLMRLLISDIVNADPDIEVIDTATNGKDAAEKTLSLKPDVVLLDMNMGEYDGEYAVKKIMESCPTPIIILSAIGNESMTPILNVMEMGAFDYLNKPDKGSSKIRELDTILIQKIKVAATTDRNKLTGFKKSSKNTNYHSFGDKVNYDVIVIGSSTGGPSALETVITNLPTNLAVPVLIAQHMPSNFVPSFAQRLNQLTGLNVVMARKDDKVVAGNVFIMPGSRNAIIKRNEIGQVVIDYTSVTYKEFNYPSVNALMLSVAEVYGNRAIGVILTGMGKDGADGMCAIKNAGGYTLVQNKETSVVFGMPGAVLDRGCATQTVPIQEIGGFLVSCL
jgi:two-component system, chemotaxis family, protein-glutamate methylesterase/glutaminase